MYMYMYIHILLHVYTLYNIHDQQRSSLDITGHSLKPTSAHCFVICYILVSVYSMWGKDEHTVECVVVISGVCGCDRWSVWW